MFVVAEDAATVAAVAIGQSVRCSKLKVEAGPTR
jgi:hypothetical protein